MSEILTSEKNQQWLISIKLMAFEWGISPLFLNDMELLDIGYYIISSYNRRKADEEFDIRKTKQIVFMQTSIQTAMIGNSMSKRPKKLTYEDFFNEEKGSEEDYNRKILLERHNRMMARKHGKGVSNE